jgi:malonate-semialdehyde dehydrogenase (acetylating)/methylmalonate-semialdehyde dehydrogenase
LAATFAMRACGDAAVRRQSERSVSISRFAVPLTTIRLAELLQEAGAPDGVMNIIHGQHDAVNFICDAPESA